MRRDRELREIGVIAVTLGIRGLRELGFNIPGTNWKVRYVLEQMEKQIELPSASAIAKVGDIELQEIMENTARSM